MINRPPVPSLTPVLGFDLDVENGGHHVRLSGSESRIEAEFPNFRSLWHFFRMYPSLRNLAPRAAELRVRWRGLGFRVR